MDTTVKFLGDAGDGFKIGGYGIVYGGADLTNDYFDKSTDFWFGKLSQTPMVLFQHGSDATLKRSVVGQVVAKKDDEFGIWIEAQVAAAEQYAAAIRRLVEKGLLGWSSGAVNYLVDRVKQADGRSWIKSWPIAEFSLTPTPAEPRTLGVRTVKSLAGFDASLDVLLDDGRIEDGRLVGRTDADLETARRQLAEADFFLAELRDPWFAEQRRAFREIDAFLAAELARDYRELKRRQLELELATIDL